ncbi:MAG: hypothetical protein J5711_01005 [Bacteroidales bacterium]|nr:hypothetical protein [Bacteroidales bacterium]
MNDEEYCRIVKLDTLESCRDYMKVMTDFYFDTIFVTCGKPVHSVNLNDARTWLQMMFSKSVHFARALEGFDYYKGFLHLNRITDHTVLFSLVRDMFESYISFGLIYTLPSTEQQSDLLYYLFAHAGLQERFDNLSEDAQSNNPEWLRDQKQQIDACKQNIYENELYKNNEGVRKVVDNALKSKVNKYRYRFADDNLMVFVPYEQDETLKLLGINSSVFEGIYHYFSLMTHPSAVAIDQFSVAYKNLEEGSIMLASTATRYAISILSLFIREYAKLFPEVQTLFSMLSKSKCHLLSLYGDIVIKDAHRSY